jgi:uncharacterized protein (TIGR00266 family)
MEFQILGTTMQTLSIELNSGETVFSQTNAMAWMSDCIDMKTNTGGGFFAGVGRALSGASFFITDFTARAAGKIAFAPRFPGSILAFKLAPNESIVCRKQTFLCAEKSVQLSTAFQRKLGAGFFAGEGFIMQSVTGPGTVWLDLSGEVVVEELTAGQRLLVHAGHVGAQSPSVAIDIQMVRGFRNLLFGGEGLFLATLTGPGRVWLQSMPIMNLAEAIARYLPQQGGDASENVAGGILGGVIKGIMKS